MGTRIDTLRAQLGEVLTPQERARIRAFDWTPDYYVGGVRDFIGEDIAPDPLLASQVHACPIGYGLAQTIAREHPGGVRHAIRMAHVGTGAYEDTLDRMGRKGRTSNDCLALFISTVDRIRDLERSGKDISLPTALKVVSELGPDGVTVNNFVQQVFAPLPGEEVNEAETQEAAGELVAALMEMMRLATEKEPLVLA